MIIKKFTPLNKHVLVELLEKDNKTDGGIFLPDNTQGESKFGKVISVHDDKPTTKVGDVVMFASYSSNKLVIDGKDHLVLEETDILGKVE